MEKFEITGSIVLYKPDRLVLKSIQSFLNCTMRKKLILIDNSPTDECRNLITHPDIEYIFNNNNNVGFGAGHNIAIRRIIDISDYHLILNPDVYFDSGVLEAIVNYMRQDAGIGIVMPKVIYGDGSIQYVAKLLPTPFDFFIRRFMPFWPFSALSERFELRQSNYDKIMVVPFLSGCFQVFNIQALKEVGLFDENIFMYTEDIDISRRMLRRYRTIFYPEQFIYHLHERKSFRNFKTLKVYLRSAIYYFNKWGWFFDRERRDMNQKTLSQFK